MTTDMLMQRRKLQTALATLLDRLPPDMQDAEDVKMLCAAAREMPVSVVHLIHRSRRWKSNSKDYEFSRRSMLEHWAAGRSEEPTSELQSQMRISYAAFSLKKKTSQNYNSNQH